MSSQDTMNMAQSEEENAKIIQQEIDKKQADIELLRKDMESISEVVTGLQETHRQHTNEAQRLRQQVVQEQQQEQQEQLRKQQQEQDSIMRDAAKDAAKNTIQRGFFG